MSNGSVECKIENKQRISRLVSDHTYANGIRSGVTMLFPYIKRNTFLFRNVLTS